MDKSNQKSRSGKGKVKDKTKKEDQHFWEKVSSSQKKKSSPVTPKRLPSKAIPYVFAAIRKGNALQLSENKWHDDLLRKKWNNEDEEIPGPSQSASSQVLGTQIVSESELTQLALIQPLVLSINEQSVIKDSFKMLQKTEFGIFQEFMSLEYQNMSGQFSCNYGNKLSNREKNRYRDILPYDSTCVLLGENKDYINASYIRIINSEEEYFYIATQGPLPGTVDDFWQMVLENNSDVIVMITKEIEGGVVKCHRYWPISVNKPLELRSCRIFLKNYQMLQDFIIRIFQVVKNSTGASHFVKQMQFTNWPDHGTPTSVDDFIKYVRYVRKNHLTGPLVVHCSAGVGRTGVFLCVDVVFCAIEKNFTFNIWNIVSQMRQQRPGMIQTQDLIKPLFWENIALTNCKIVSLLSTGSHKIPKRDSYLCFLAKSVRCTDIWRTQFTKSLSRIDQLSTQIGFHFSVFPFSSGASRSSEDELPFRQGQEPVGLGSISRWAEFLLSSDECISEQSKTKIDVYIESPRGNFCPA